MSLGKACHGRQELIVGTRASLDGCKRVCPAYGAVAPPCEVADVAYGLQANLRIALGAIPQCPSVWLLSVPIQKGQDRLDGTRIGGRGADSLASGAGVMAIPAAQNIVERHARGLAHLWVLRLVRSHERDEQGQRTGVGRVLPPLVRGVAVVARRLTLATGHHPQCEAAHLLQGRPLLWWQMEMGLHRVDDERRYPCPSEHVPAPRAAWVIIFVGLLLHRL